MTAPLINAGGIYPHAISFFGGDNEYVQLRVYKSLLNSIDVPGLREYLTNEPITVQYKLATESVKIVDLTPLKKPYEGTNHYQLTSNIPCEAILEVPIVSTGEQTLKEINNN